MKYKAGLSSNLLSDSWKYLLCDLGQSMSPFYCLVVLSAKWTMLVVGPLVCWEIKWVTVRKYLINILGFMAASHYYHPGKCLVYPNSMSSVRMNMTQKKKKERERLYYIQTTTWMELKDIMQGERRQSPKEDTISFHLYDIPRRQEKKKWCRADQCLMGIRD